MTVARLCVATHTLSTRCVSQRQRIALAAAAALGEAMPQPLRDLGLTEAMVAPGRLPPTAADDAA